MKSPRPERMTGPIRRSVMIAYSILAFILITILFAIFSGFNAGIVLLVGLVIVVIIALIQSRDRSMGTNNLIAMTALSEGLCASCAFSLDGLIPEPDGCLICPECGHAWDQLRIVRPHWEVADDSVPRSKEPRLDYRKTLMLLMLTRFAPDHCGRLVRVHNTRLWCAQPETVSQHDRESITDAVVQLRRLGCWPRRICFFIGMAFAVFGTLYWVIPALAESVGSGVFLGIVMGIVALIAVLIYTSSYWAGLPRISDTLLSRGWCGSCLNDLTRTPVNANAMRVCELCKASWFDERILQDEPLSDSPPGA